MADAYVCTIYATAATAQAAINAAASGKLVSVVPFKEGSLQKFMVTVSV